MPPILPTWHCALGSRSSDASAAPAAHSWIWKGKQSTKSIAEFHGVLHPVAVGIQKEGAGPPAQLSSASTLVTTPRPHAFLVPGSHQDPECAAIDWWSRRARPVEESRALHSVCASHCQPRGRGAAARTELELHTTLCLTMTDSAHFCAWLALG